MRPRRLVIGLVITLVSVLALSAFLSAMVMVIWPGSFKLTAPVLCPDDLPDPVVVEYSVQTSDGTGTNFTLFCVGERGEFTEIGTWRPYALITLVIGGAIVALVIGLTVIRLVTVVRARSGSEQPSRPLPDEGSAVSASPAPEDSDSPLIS